jgi:hypothetical protein
MMRPAYSVRRTRPEIARGRLILDREHPWSSSVLFAWNARAGIGMQDMTGRARLTMGSGAKLAESGGVVGISHQATSSLLSYVLPSERLSAYTGEQTIVWRGVLLGNQVGATYPCFVGLMYGDGLGSPYTIGTLTRGNGNVNCHYYSQGSDSSYDFNLNGKYGIPFVAAATNGVATTAVRFACVYDDGKEYFGNASLSGTPSNPRSSTTNNQLCIGGYPSDTGRYINGISESAVMFDRSVPDVEDLLDLVRNYGSLYRYAGASRDLAGLMGTIVAPNNALPILQSHGVFV